MSAELPVCLHTETSIHWMIQCSEGQIDFTTTIRQQKIQNNNSAFQIILGPNEDQYFRHVHYDMWKWLSTHIAGQKSSTNFLSLGVQHTAVLVKVTFFFCRKWESIFSHIYTRVCVCVCVCVCVYIYPVLMLIIKQRASLRTYWRWFCTFLAHGDVRRWQGPRQPRLSGIEASQLRKADWAMGLRVAMGGLCE